MTEKLIKFGDLGRQCWSDCNYFQADQDTQFISLGLTSRQRKTTGFS